MQNSCEQLCMTISPDCNLTFAQQIVHGLLFELAGENVKPSWISGNLVSTT